MTGEKRSVIRIGPILLPTGDGREAIPARSYQMTLPKWWCRKHGFPTSVYVSEEADGALRVEAGKEEG